MNPRARASLMIISLGLLALWAGRPSPQDSEATRHSPAPAARGTPNETPESWQSLGKTMPPAKPPGSTRHEPTTPASRFAFEALLWQKKPLRIETRPFEALTWEPDLVQALELPPRTPLQRRTAVIHVPELPHSLVRVDRVYRLDRQAASASATANTAAPESASALMEAEGGELLWENAMLADHLMVQVEDGISLEQLEGSLPAGVTVRTAITTRGLYLVAVPAEGDRSVERAVLAMSKLKGVVRHAEPDFLICGADTSPNDPLFTTDASDTSKQWHLPKIMAPRAWDVIRSPKTTTIANQTVVAVVDTGVDYTHPDLAANIWNNPGETGSGKETNGIDDDGNGKIDDWRGWNFVELNNEVMDDVGHGTHVAGIIGAVGNNATGASGVCWGVKILPLRIIKAVPGGTFGTYSAAIGAMDYIRTLNNTGRKVAVANHSWGGTGYSLAMLNTINNPLSTADPLPTGITSTYLSDVNTMTVNGGGSEVAKIKVGMTLSGPGIPSGTLVTIVSGSSITLSDHTKTAGTNAALTFSNPVRPKPYGVVHVAAAGNSRFNLDRIPIYPACLPSGFIVSVGATDSSDAEAVWSGGSGTNYGRLNVDLFAPGSSIWSTKWKAPGDPAYGYESRNGTSMAAPQVAGAAALIRMWQPALTELQARQVLIGQVDPGTALKDKCVSGGRLNMAKIIDRLYQPVLVGSGGATSGDSTMTDALQAAQSITGRLAMTSRHALFVNQGEVWAWGNNEAGQLGDGTLASSATPKKIAGLSDVVMVAASLANSYALRSDGTVWAWGISNYIGNGSSSGQYRASPEQVLGLNDVVWIAAGPVSSFSRHVLAVRADGTVWSWGTNNNGQLGDGTTTIRHAPVQVVGATNVVQVDTGGMHSLALRSDGTVYAWGGRNTTVSNPLGDGAINGDATTPVVVPGLTNVVSVEGSFWGSIFLKSDGTVWSSGFISPWPSPQPNTVIPTQIPSLSNIQVIAAGQYHALAVDQEGKLFAWGDGTSGSLGTGSEMPLSAGVSVQIPGGSSVIACAAGINSSMVLDGDGRLWVAGSNTYGQMGLAKYPWRTLPVPMPTLTDVAAIGGGRRTCWARKIDGSFFMWGECSYFSNGTTLLPLCFQAPVGYPTINRLVLDVVSGSYSGGGVDLMARCADGSLWSWGVNRSGSLGRGLSPSATPQPVQIADLQNIAVVASGSYFTVVADSSGNVHAWGDNTYGQLGDGTTTTRGVPALVPGLTSVVGLAAGDGYAMALKSDGTVWTWGRNTFGQLGDGTTTNRSTPQQVPGLGNVIQIGSLYGISGYDAAFALRSDGSLFGWGKNGLYFARALSEGFQTSPQFIYKPPQGTVLKFTVASDGGSVVTALLSDHTVISWGVGGYLLGRAPGSAAVAYEPAPVFGATDVVDIAQAGNGPFFFLKTDGTVWVCGSEPGGTNSGTIGLNESWRDMFTPVVGFGAISTTLSTLGTGSIADSWYFQNFSTPEILDAGASGDLATPAGDGIPNLIKYALGLNPRLRHGASSLPSARVDLIGGSAQSTSTRGGIGLFSLPTVDLTNGKRYMAFTVPRNGIHTDVNYIVEVSTDLVTWRSGDPHTVTVLDTAETLEVYSAQSLDDVPKQFMRLKVQRK